MPCGKRCGSTTMFAFASRPTCQQSSMLTYSYPASFMPDLTTASAIFLIISSLTLQPNLFHEFHPMGGVSARLADRDALPCAGRFGASSERQQETNRKMCLVFMPHVVPELSAD